MAAIQWRRGPHWRSLRATIGDGSTALVERTSPHHGTGPGGWKLTCYAPLLGTHVEPRAQTFDSQGDAKSAGTHWLEARARGVMAPGSHREREPHQPHGASSVQPGSLAEGMGYPVSIQRIDGTGVIHAAHRSRNHPGYYILECDGRAVSGYAPLSRGGVDGARTTCKRCAAKGYDRNRPAHPHSRAERKSIETRLTRRSGRRRYRSR